MGTERAGTKKSSIEASKTIRKPPLERSKIEPGALQNAPKLAKSGNDTQLEPQNASKKRPKAKKQNKQDQGNANENGDEGKNLDDLENQLSQAKGKKECHCCRLTSIHQLTVLREKQEKEVNGTCAKH